MLKRVLVAMLSFACFTVLAGCNTMAGLGKDVEKVGDKLQDKARR